MIEVQHIIHEQKFVVRHGVGEAVLSYQLVHHQGKSGIDFCQTYVPPELRGKGLAEALVNSGLAWAKSQGFEVHASCWYVAKFFR